MPVRLRKALMLALVGSFVLQSALVYSDRTGWRMPPLSSDARRGQELWRRHNCQSCHQIYGFGGFIGPDLTNASPRLAPEWTERVLTAGSKQMPAYRFGAGERRAILAFLAELDRTGVSQPRRASGADPVALFESAVAERAPADPLSAEQQRGRKIVSERRCLSCHGPARGVIGPDLLTVLQRRRPAEIDRVLEVGTQRGMPALGLPVRDRQAVIEFLGWIGRHREALDRPFARQATSTGLPWFEYADR